LKTSTCTCLNHAQLYMRKSLVDLSMAIDPYPDQFFRPSVVARHTILVPYRWCKAFRQALLVTQHFSTSLYTDTRNTQMPLKRSRWFAHHLFDFSTNFTLTMVSILVDESQVQASLRTAYRPLLNPMNSCSTTVPDLSVLEYTCAWVHSPPACLRAIFR
jgi:hypothetical protein